MSTPSPSERRVSDDDARGFLKDAHLVGPWAVDLASNLLAERAISGKRRQWIADHQWNGAVWNGREEVSGCPECEAQFGDVHTPECSVPSLTTTPE